MDLSSLDASLLLSEHPSHTEWNAEYARLSEMDDDAKKFPIVAKTETEVALNTVMSNSFGFGGTNAALIFEKV